MASTSSTSAASSCLSPETKQNYTVMSNKQVSPDSNLLSVRFEGRDYLGWDPVIPTCVSVTYDNTETGEVLSKSYSPISHPSQKETFDLLVKAYPYQPGGGVGAYLCNLQAGDTLLGKVKKPRIMHGSSQVLGRGWKHVGLVAGGTGIAPLYQLLQILLREEEDTPTRIHVLSINRYEHDILMRTELDQLAEQYPDRVFVTYSLTGTSYDDAEGGAPPAEERVTTESNSPFHYGRGNVDLARQALPDPSLGDQVMVFVCGKNGFVETWGGKVMRERTTDGSKGPKIQGPLLGLLKEAGFDASQVFKY